MANYDYRILSLKWSDSHTLWWYRPEGMGYTSVLDEAGLFTETEAKAHVLNGVTIAVHRLIVDQLAQRMVNATHKNFLIEQAFNPEQLKQEGESDA